jgi:hypothetical protein
MGPTHAVEPFKMPVCISLSMHEYAGNVSLIRDQADQTVYSGTGDEHNGGDHLGSGVSWNASTRRTTTSRPACPTSNDRRAR